MNRHQFLAELHRILNPRGYVEIGVQTGASLRLASCPALGIDPNPVVAYPLPSTTVIAAETSDEFFARPMAEQHMLGLPPLVDLAFIDGMHLVEFAGRDFANLERHSWERTVVVFDDVLPRSQAEAGRTPLAGDWTGDVWKVAQILADVRPELSLTLVDVEPTGVLMVTRLDPGFNVWPPLQVDDDLPVPDAVLARTRAVTPKVALAGVDW